MTSDQDHFFMRRALELANRGEGYVEPNPMVGCVIVQHGEIVGEGYHEEFGGPHAEVLAIKTAGHRTASPRTRGATCYVTLEPCCYIDEKKKTPPCVPQLIAAGVRRVVVALQDPNPKVAGNGILQLRRANIKVDVGILEDEAAKLCAPFRMVQTQKRPWIHGKWAMTLDGKIATRTGSSQWISGSASRAYVHRLRSRMDAVMIGIGTARADAPMLTPRYDMVANEKENEVANDGENSLPWQVADKFPRLPLRVVLDTSASLPLTCQLVQTAKEYPLLVAVGAEAPQLHIDRLKDAGCEVLVLQSSPLADRQHRMTFLLNHLAERGVTNLFVEGGSQLLGHLFDTSLLDEIHVFLVPKLIGGECGVSPIGGIGLADMTAAAVLQPMEYRCFTNDVYFRGRMVR